MNILFLTKVLPYPPNNGHRNRTFHILKGLADKHNVSLVCFGDTERDKEREKGLRDYCSLVTIVASKKPQNKLVFFFSLLGGIFSGLPYAIRSRYSPDMKQTVENILREGKIDCVVCDSIYQAVHLPKQANSKIILTEHNIESLIIYRYLNTEKNIFKKAYAFLEWIKFWGFENKTWPFLINALSSLNRKGRQCSGELNRKILR